MQCKFWCTVAVPTPYCCTNGAANSTLNNHAYTPGIYRCTHQTPIAVQAQLYGFVLATAWQRQLTRGAGREAYPRPSPINAHRSPQSGSLQHTAFLSTHQVSQVSQPNKSPILRAAAACCSAPRHGITAPAALPIYAALPTPPHNRTPLQPALGQHCQVLILSLLSPPPPQRDPGVALHLRHLAYRLLRHPGTCG